MIERFIGDTGKALLVEAITEQKIIVGNADLAEEIATVGNLRQLAAGDVLITQGESDNDVYLILTGSFSIQVNGKRIATRGPKDHVGEMAAIQPSQPRSATVIALETSVVSQISIEQFVEFGKRYPELWRWIAKELARRLEQRNQHVTTARDKIKVFVISSAEALPIARSVRANFEYDSFNVTVWPDGVFRASTYPIETLERELDESDFAIAIAAPDDLTTSRGQSAAVARDNVVFELGLFIGRLGLKRSFLLEPRGEEIALPSDLSGITTLGYRTAAEGAQLISEMAFACDKIRMLIHEQGPKS